MDPYLTIGDVARAAGVATSTLRYWERQRLLEPPRRRSGRRVYEPEVLDRVALVQLAQCAGFALPEIRALLRGFPPRAAAGERWRSLIGSKQTEVRARIAELERMLAVLGVLERCECPDLDACGAWVRRRTERSGEKASRAPRTTRRSRRAAPAE